MAAIASYGVGPALSNGSVDILNCDLGDPLMFESYWKAHSSDNVQQIRVDDTLSYVGKKRDRDTSTLKGTWFVHDDLEDAVREIHNFVGNAVTKDRTIVVGHGSTQLYRAALIALTSKREGSSVAVVAEAPYYSEYPKFPEGQNFHWAGDAKVYQPQDGDSFIEIVTSPNNPCGALRRALVSGNHGVVVHDLAYYWPTFTPITAALDHDIMLFSLSKCTGHGGLRIGWAIVKDPDVANAIADQIGSNTLGVCQDAQVRAAGLIRAITNGYDSGKQLSSTPLDSCKLDDLLANRKFFHYHQAVMTDRWIKVRDALAGNKKFSVPAPSDPAICNFLGISFSTLSAFIWLKSEAEDSDCQNLLKSNGILARAGPAFGATPQYARLSLVDSQDAFDVLKSRLSALS